MKIKKFNENIEWLDGEVMPLKDLTGALVDESLHNPPHSEPWSRWATQDDDFQIIKQSFARGTFAFTVFIKKDSEQFNNYFPANIDANVRVELKKKGEEINENYQFANLHILDGNGHVTKQIFGIFDTKGNLVFMFPTFLGNKRIFNGVLTFGLTISQKNRIDTRLRFRVYLNEKKIELVRP